MSDLSHPAHKRLQPGAMVALVGNPNCGKTALFNLLTGARQKVANYAGVTVERKAGTRQAAATVDACTVIDLPGTYSLRPATPDERVTLEVIEGRRAGEAQPDLIVAVVDATNLRMNLRLVLELQAPRPADGGGAQHDRCRASAGPGHRHASGWRASSAARWCETVAVRHNGHAALLEMLAHAELQTPQQPQASARSMLLPHDAAELQREVRRILAAAAPRAPQRRSASSTASTRW